MPSQKPKTKPPLDYKTIAAQYAAAKRAKELEDAGRARGDIIDRENKAATTALEQRRKALEARRKSGFERRWLWVVGFWLWILVIHAVGIAYFTSGFLLTRLVLDEKSACDAPPLDHDGSSSSSAAAIGDWPGRGTVDGGCWHPKTFNRAVVVLIDALRYDFTVPVDDNRPYHNAFPFLHDTAVRSPHNAFLRPFIADPPTSTLQRLKGLTTGTLPTFVDVGSSFSGTAIEEDNLLMQLRDVGKRIVHLGDDTWETLFPGYFEANISRAYDSFNVWDLHTVDQGVIDHIFPLMGRTGDWDVLIGHCLGVDHAGHRYGPDHVEMTRKLAQMNKFIEGLAATIDEDTLLVVMGDHGMDAKGDHGGESDDEIEAALWMYSPRPVFGRTQPEFATPPATAKLRPVNQIDLVPTLALLLGIPVPFNNLGRPIEEAFAGTRGDSPAWSDLAAVEHVTAAGIRRYQASYFAARGIERASGPGSPADLWGRAEGLVQSAGKKKGDDWAAVFAAFAAYQGETLRICKSLWARFDVPNMVLGIAIMVLGIVALLVHVSKDEDESPAVLDDFELELAEKTLELQGIQADDQAVAGLPNQALDRKVVLAALLGAVPGAAVGLLQFWFSVGADDWHRSGAFAALTSILAVLVALGVGGKTITRLWPTSIWSWMAAVFTLSQSVGFASNSYTIWEDSISHFFLTTFGFAAALASFRIPSLTERSLAVYHSAVFVLLGQAASYSKLCREEQMPYCMSTYYASETSSTSAPWQLVIPFVAFLVLPSIIKAFLTTTRSYEGLAPMWVDYGLRAGLFLSAAYWTLDAADNGSWFPSLPDKALKNVSVYGAQTILSLAFVAGTTAFVWAPPCVSIVTSAASSKASRAQVAVLGYGNSHGARYLLLVLNLLVGCFLLSKPMGGGALALMAWQVLSLAEVLDLNGLTVDAECVGPVVLALLGNFHFFATGHQATFSAIQWDSAFVPLFAIRYPWSPLMVVLNTFAGQILAATAAPLLALWKVGPRRGGGVLDAVARALGLLVAYYAVEAAATMAWAAYLRRHLMLYRVFSPRFMTAAAILLVVDVVVVVVALAGVRVNVLSVSEVFGWAE